MTSKVNGLMIASVIINIIVSLISLITYDSPIGYIISIFGIINVIGFITAALLGKKGSYGFYIVGCFFFVPIGMIGIMGARKILDEMKKREMGLEAE